MNDPRFKKAIEEIRSIGMTAEEKKTMLVRVFEQSASRQLPVISPWSAYSFRVWFMRNRALSMSLSVLAIIMVLGGGTALAAEGTIPGDILYQVKVNITEPVRQALAPTTQERAELAVNFAVQRVQEAETLAADGRLDSPKKSEISKLIEKQTRVLDTTLDKVAVADPVAAAGISRDFNEKMSEHARKLDEVANEDQARAASVAASVTIKTSAPSGSPDTSAVTVKTIPASLKAAGYVSPRATTSAPETVKEISPHDASSNASAAEIANQARKSGEDIGSHDWNIASSTATDVMRTEDRSTDIPDINLNIPSNDKSQSRNDRNTGNGDDNGGQKASLGGLIERVNNQDRKDGH